MVTGRDVRMLVVIPYGALYLCNFVMSKANDKRTTEL